MLRLLLVTSLVAVPLWQCTTETVPEAIVRPVRYQVVERSQQAAVRTFAGVAQGGLESRLSFRVRGPILELPISVGDEVEEGDLIARVDPTDYEVAVAEVQASVAAARSQQRNAEAEHERIRLLYENGVASRSDLDAARAFAESTRALVRANRQRLQAARDQVSYTTLTAPSAGAVAAVPVEVGENVVSGETVAVISSGTIDFLEVQVRIPGALIGRVSRDMPATATFNALRGRTYPVTVTEVGVAAIGGASYPVTVRLSELDANLRSGMAAEVTFDFGNETEEGRFWLPTHAVIADRSGSFVYVVEPDPERESYGTAQRRDVVVGELDARGLEVAEGLEEGDRVVIMGVGRLTDGQAIRVLPPEELTAP